jgi:hypothetical protein
MDRFARFLGLVLIVVGAQNIAHWDAWAPEHIPGMGIAVCILGGISYLVGELHPLAKDF